MNDKNHGDEDSEEIINGDDQQDIFLKTSPRANIIEYRFYDEIGEPKKYLNLIRALENASPNDIINLHFVCDGGRMDAMQAIITAIRRCPGRVIGHLDSHTASAGSIIFLCCHAWSISNESYMMFHDFSGGLFGKGNEMTSQLTHYVKNFQILMEQICFPFFDKNEIKAICDGKDCWLDAPQITKRLNALGAYREKMANPPKPKVEVTKKKTAAKKVVKKK